MKNQPTRPITVAQAASALGLSVYTIRAWISQRKISHLKLGRAVRVLPAEIERLLNISVVTAKNGLPRPAHSAPEKTEKKREREK